MGFRFRKSFKIAPGVRFNINKKSSSISFGNKKFRYTINSKGRKTSTVNLPGTGISYSKTTSAKTNSTPTYSESSTFLKNSFMFTDKLNYYDKPCKWLKFLLNIWWPLSCIACLFSIGEDISNWSNAVPSFFIFNIVLTLGYFACGLFARFLDKTAMSAIYVMEGLVIARSFWGLFYSVYNISAITPSETEYSSVISVMVDSAISAISGFAIGIIIMVTIIQVLIAVITIMYIQKRKDLFLSSEKELKKFYEE